MTTATPYEPELAARGFHYQDSGNYAYQDFFKFEEDGEFEDFTGINEGPLHGCVDAP